MLDVDTPVMDEPNWVCPNCEHQFHLRDLMPIAVVSESYSDLVDNTKCNHCDEDIHPEDAYLKYLDNIPESEVIGRTLSFGGFSHIGTKELPVGQIEEMSLGFDQITIDLTLLAETNRTGDLSIRELQGDQLEWYTGNLVIDDAVYVDITPSDESEVGFITSWMPDSATDKDSVTVAYHIQTRYNDLPQPPWVELLGNATELFFRGRPRPVLPLLFAAYDNHLNRQLMRLLDMEGKSDREIEEFFQEYYTWNERSKGGLEKLIGEGFTTNHAQLHMEFDKSRKIRDNHIIHIDPDEEVVDLTNEEVRDIFEKTIKSILTIHNICLENRE